MRTNIDIDDDLMKATMRATGKKTKKEAVEESMRRVVQLEAQKKLLALKGKVEFEEDFLRDRKKAR
jgi:Arc/MetJ family transcription regulator